MESSLTEYTARTQKAEREYTVLRVSIKGLVVSFQTDAESLREEKRREEKRKSDAEKMGHKYKLLLEQVQKKRKSRGLGEIKWLLHENKRIAEQMEVSLTEEMQAVRGEVNRHVQGSDEAIQTAKCVLFLVLWCIRSWYLFRMLSTELSRLQAGTIAAWQEACNNGWIYCAVETGRPPEGAERETGRGPLGPLLWVTSGAAGGGMAYWGC